MANPKPSIPAIPAGAPVVTIPTHSSSLWDRVSTWVSDNKTVVYTAAGVAVVVTGAGVAYYLTQDSSSNGTSKLSKKERRKRKEAERKAGEDNDQSAEKPATPQAKPPASDPLDQLPEITESTVETFSASDRESYAKTFKAAGNAAYGSKDYNKAIGLYTKAILCNPNEPVFYSNRAACHNALGKLDLVVEDCSAALSIDSMYEKPLNRRAVAYENLKQHSEALLDFTALCIIKGFKDDTLAQSVERLLKVIAENKAKKLLAARSDKMPSYIFVGNYLQSFREKPRPEGLEDSADLDLESGKGQLRLGLQSLAEKTQKGYEEARKAFDKAIELGDLGDYEALAYNMRGTFRCLLAHHQEALDDFTKSIELDPNMTESYIKRASIIVEQGRFEEAEKEFQTAINKNPQDPDIYYHQAQALFIQNDHPSHFADAVKGYQKSIDLDPDFIYSHIQLGVSQYKMGSIASAMATFKRCIKNFENVPDVYNYYGELLLDQGKHQEAMEKFDRAIEMEKQTKPNAINVLPLINKALAVFQHQQDMDEAVELCKQALEIDPECDIAVATLAQILLQQGKVSEAVAQFERAAEIGRTEAEVTNALSYAEASKTQLAVQEKYPVLAQKLQGTAAAARAM